VLAGTERPDIRAVYRNLQEALPAASPARLPAMHGAFRTPASRRAWPPATLAVVDAPAEAAAGIPPTEWPGPARIGPAVVERVGRGPCSGRAGVADGRGRAHTHRRPPPRRRRAAPRTRRRAGCLSPRPVGRGRPGTSPTCRPRSSKQPADRRNVASRRHPAMSRPGRCRRRRRRSRCSRHPEAVTGRWRRRSTPRVGPRATAAARGTQRQPGNGESAPIPRAHGRSLASWIRIARRTTCASNHRPARNKQEHPRRDRAL
jgi:hypothetical protein